MSEANLNFKNTEIAYSDKSKSDLKQMKWIFNLMNKPIMVTILSKLGLLALKLQVPFTKTILRKTMFKQFCGGESLMDCQPVIDNLHQQHSLTILDYSAEAKSEEEEMIGVMLETIRAINFAASNISIPIVSSKFTGLISNDLLEKMQNKIPLSDEDKTEIEKFEYRVHEIAKAANENNVGLFVDAEETWIQDPIDEIVEQLMMTYNKERAIIFNTYQMYIKSKLGQLKGDYEKAQKEGYILGAKLVRGAYMDKERERAEEMGYESPICDTKEDTDKSYNDGVRFIVDHYETLSSCNATHNEDSNMLQAQLIEERNILKTHKHLNFAQLFGMSDHITFNLGNAGYNAAKYLPYGAITEVFPYLVRRAEENKSISGEMGKELKNIVKEIKRRKL